MDTEFYGKKELIKGEVVTCAPSVLYNAHEMIPNPIPTTDNKDPRKE